MDVQPALAAWILVSLTTLAGCGRSSPAGPSVQSGARFTLARGQTATLQDSGVQVEFVAVLSDSRCPADVVCVRLGEAVLQLRVHDNGLTAAYELSTSPPSRASVTHRNLTVDLLDLQPYPFSSRRINGDDYRATLLIQ